MSLAVLIVLTRPSSKGEQMNTYAVQDDLETVTAFVKTVTESDNSLDFCKRIVHSDSQGLIVGCQLYFLDNHGKFKQVASYGKQPKQPEELSAFDQNPMAEAIRTKTAAITLLPGRSTLEDQGGKAMTKHLITVPFMRSGEPVGVMRVVVEADHISLDVDQQVIESISQLGAHYLETVGVNGEKNSATLGDTNIDALTDRQITILKFMGQGMTNAQIATELMLSESSIRQETVKIYRAMGVKSRHQAALKGRALGIIPKRELGN